MIVHCKCGATYDLTEVHVSQRDKDSVECGFCGETIKHWNGASYWIAKLIKEPGLNSAQTD